MNRETTYNRWEKKVIAFSVKRMFLFSFAFLFILILTSFSTAAPPFQTDDSLAGLHIGSYELDQVKTGQDVTLTFHIFNDSNSIPIRSSGVTAYFHMQRLNGTSLIEAPLVADSNGYDLYYTVSGSNIISPGSYPYIVFVNNSNQGGFLSSQLVVTTTGNSGSTTVSLTLILLLGGLAVFALGIYTQNEYLGFLAGALFIVGGIFVMIYGLGDIADTYTRAIAFVSIGFGLILEVAAGYAAATKSDNGE